MLGFITKSIAVLLFSSSFIFWPLESWGISQHKVGALAWHLCFRFSWPRAVGLLPGRACVLVLSPCRVWNTHSFQRQLLIVFTKVFPTLHLHCPWSRGNWLQAGTMDNREGAGVPGLSLWAIFWYPTWGKSRTWSEWRERPHPEASRAGLAVVWPACVWISLFHFHNCVTLVHWLHLFEPQF